MHFMPSWTHTQSVFEEARCAFRLTQLLALFSISRHLLTNTRLYWSGMLVLIFIALSGSECKHLFCCFAFIEEPTRIKGKHASFLRGLQQPPPARFSPAASTWRCVRCMSQALTPPWHADFLCQLVISFLCCTHTHIICVCETALSAMLTNFPETFIVSSKWLIYIKCGAGQPSSVSDSTREIEHFKKVCVCFCVSTTMTWFLWAAWQ